MVSTHESNTWKQARQQFWDELADELKKRKQEPDAPELARRLELLRQHADTEEGEILYHRSPHEIAEALARGGYANFDKTIDEESRRRF